MKKTLFFICLAALATACTNDEAIEVPESNQENQSRSVEEIIPVDTLTIHFNDVVYKNVPTTTDVNGNLVFLDEEFAPIYNEKLATNPTLSTFVTGENEITFYANLEEGLEEQDLTLVEGQDENVAISRVGVSVLASVTLYEDRNYGGSTKYYQVNEQVQSVNISTMKVEPNKFNDRCSSIKIENLLPWNSDETMPLDGSTILKRNVSAVLIGYEDINYGGRTIVCVAESGTTRNCPSLPNFNDKMSSLKFKLAQRGLYTNSF